MHLFPSAYFHPADNGQPGLLRGATGRLDILGRVMVADSYHMKTSLAGFPHHRRGRHLPLRARRKAGVDVKIGE
jgi:hypothetical protein